MLAPVRGGRGRRGARGSPRLGAAARRPGRPRPSTSARSRASSVAVGDLLVADPAIVEIDLNPVIAGPLARRGRRRPGRGGRRGLTSAPAPPRSRRAPAPSPDPIRTADGARAAPGRRTKVPPRDGSPVVVAARPVPVSNVATHARRVEFRGQSPSGSPTPSGVGGPTSTHRLIGSARTHGPDRHRHVGPPPLEAPPSPVRDPARRVVRDARRGGDVARDLHRQRRLQRELDVRDDHPQRHARPRRST